MGQASSSSKICMSFRAVLTAWRRPVAARSWERCLRVSAMSASWAAMSGSLVQAQRAARGTLCLIDTSPMVRSALMRSMRMRLAWAGSGLKVVMGWVLMGDPVQSAELETVRR